MSCDQVKQCVLEGAELSPALRQHAETCEVCSELLLFMEALPHGDEPQSEPTERFADEGEPSELELSAAQQQIKELIAHEQRGLARFKSIPTLWARLITIFLAFAVLAIVVVTKGRPDLQVYPEGRMTGALIALAVGFLITLRLSFRPLFLPYRPASQVVALTLGFALPFVLGALPMAHAAYPASLGGVGAALVPRAAVCLVWGVIVALPLMALVLVLRRWGWQSRAHAFALAILLGLFGNWALQLHCPITHPEHLLLGHAPVVLCFVLLAWVLSARARAKLV